MMPNMTDAERTLIHEALRFAVWAAGEGIATAKGEDARGPEDFLFDYSCETGDKDWATLPDRIVASLEPAATCNESLQVEPAAPEAQLVAFLNELSGNTGELIDRMAAAIRDWGSHYDDGPWETLSEDRKAGWRGDAERALAVVKEYLTNKGCVILARSEVEEKNKEIAALRDALDDAADALDRALEDVEHWGAYAGEYFQDKHDLDGDLSRISEQATAARRALEGGNDERA